LSIENALRVNYDYSFIETLKSFLLHFVSGWDALPGPSYIQELSFFPWIFVTLFSGLFIAGPMILLYFAIVKKTYFQNNEKRFALFLLLVFNASQLALLNTATEFRFNLLGWMVSGLIWIFVVSVLKDYLKLKPIALLIIILTLGVIIIGQYTLNLSEVWKNCT
jgi:hypothetical protein